MLVTLSGLSVMILRKRGIHRRTAKRSLGMCRVGDTTPSLLSVGTENKLQAKSANPTLDLFMTILVLVSTMY